MRFPLRFPFRVRMLLLAALASLLFLGGCAGVRERHDAANVVDFLYPDATAPVTVASSVPVLSLPIRVAIAFVPPGSYDRYKTRTTLTEDEKQGLLRQVADHFKKYSFVKDIAVIPSAYLRPKGGFANLDQIRALYGINVIALVSYDQIQFTDEGAASLSYWTIVGAYLIPGEKNDTHTMIDTVVYDIPSRKMLFRAPGLNQIKGRSTPVNLSEELRNDGQRGLRDATQAMISNLDRQLALFEQKVKERPAEYKVVRRTGYTGGRASPR